MLGCAHGCRSENNFKKFKDNVQLPETYTDYSTYDPDNFGVVLK